MLARIRQPLLRGTGVEFGEKARDAKILGTVACLLSINWRTFDWLHNLYVLYAHVLCALAMPLSCLFVIVGPLGFPSLSTAMLFSISFLIDSFSCLPSPGHVDAYRKKTKALISLTAEFR